MTNPEHKENPNISTKWPLKAEKQLTNFQNQIELSHLKSNISRQEFEYKNLSRDWKYKVYSYTTTLTREMPIYIKIKALTQLQSRNINLIKITDINWKEYPKNSPIEKWKKVFIKIPTNKKENFEPEKISTEKLKCKWWEYFWIDVSKFNVISPLKGETDEHYEKRVMERRNQNYSKKLQKFKKHNKGF